jgi:hypothetical protein
MYSRTWKVRIEKCSNLNGDEMTRIGEEILRRERRKRGRTKKQKQKETGLI